MSHAKHSRLVTPATALVEPHSHPSGIRPKCLGVPGKTGPKPMAPHRIEAQATAAALLDRAMRDRGVSSERLGEALGVSESNVACLRDGTNAITLRDLIAASRHEVVLYRDVVTALDALAPVRRPSGVHPACLAANAMGELGDVAREVRAAFADGHLSDEERQRLRAEWLELRAVVDAAVGDLEAKGEE